MQVSDLRLCLQLSACSGLRGVIHSGGHEYNIEPAAFASAPSTGFSTSAVHGHKLAPGKHAVMSAEHVFPLARLSSVQHLFYRTADVHGGSDPWKCGSHDHDHVHDERPVGFREFPACVRPAIDLLRAVLFAEPMAKSQHSVSLKAGGDGTVSQLHWLDKLSRICFSLVQKYIELLAFNDKARYDAYVSHRTSRFSPA